MFKLLISGVALLFLVLVHLLFSTSLRWHTITPNFFLLFVISISMLRGSNAGFWWGLAAGLIYDSLTGMYFGFNGLLFMYIGVLTGILSTRLYRERIFPAVFFATSATAIYGVVTYFVYFFWGTGWMNWDFFSRTIGLEICYNGLMMMIVHRFLYGIDSFLQEKNTSFH